MTSTTMHLMWGYQAHFRVVQGIRATSLFQSLDRDLEPTVFLVGVRSDAPQDRGIACVEPTDDHWIRAEDFGDVAARAAMLRETHPEARLLHTHPVADAAHRTRLERWALRSAIRAIVEEHPERPAGRRYFVANPVPVGAYVVSLVLGLQEAVIDRHPALAPSPEGAALHPDGETRSLLDAVIGCYLESVSTALAMPDPGMGPPEGDDGALLRRAGDRLMRVVAARVDSTKYQGAYGLFANCNAIAALSYERHEASGGILLARPEHPALAHELTFKHPMSLGDSRTIRKLLELTTDRLMLHTDLESVFGLAQLVGDRPPADDCFEVRVQERDHWELRSGGRPLMRVRSGVPSLPQPRFDEMRLRRDLPRLFPGMTREAIDRLLRCVHVAVDAPRGTILVVSPDAAAEAERLGNDGTRIVPCLLEPELLQRLVMIDGAVLLDPECRCHGVGMILDGMASRRGDPSRGARYNSVVRYIYGQKGRALAVVVSEDGTIDAIPQLRPAIARREIDAMLAELEEATARLPESRQRWHEVADRCEERRFYFREDDCRRINACLARERAAAEQSGTMVFERAEFVPDPDLDETLYYT